MYHRLTTLALSVLALVGLVTINPTPAGAIPASSAVTALPTAASAPVARAAATKVRCTGATVTARSKRVCPRAVRITAASVEHIAASTTFTFGVDVRPRSRRWVDQVREVQWTLGASRWSTLLTFFGATRKHRIRQTLDYPVQWDDSELDAVCASAGGSYPTTLTVVVTTVGGVRSAPFQIPVTVAIREWDLGGTFDAFGLQTYLYCLPFAGAVDDRTLALP